MSIRVGFTGPNVLRRGLNPKGGTKFSFDEIVKKV
jgi:hypothetical protein